MLAILRFIGSLLILCSISLVGVAQNSSTTHTLVAILKTDQSAPLASKVKSSNQFRKLKVDHYEPMFKRSKSDSKYRIKHSVNLSLLYEIHFEATIPLAEAIEVVKSTGLYSSVEPKFNNHIYYQPNDPKSDSTLSPSGGNFKQNQLEKHDLFKAWDISKGDTNITIGILDTGFDFDHEDLGNIAYNLDDTINGIDDDGDMALDSLLLDNYRGWDVSDWDNDPTYSTDGHGVQVAGCSSGECDNGVGVCGTGFYCRYLPIKVAHDTTNSVISQGYQGIVYAAEQGCDIINLSWGNEGIGAYMTWQQAVINYAAIDFDVVIVASAGNTSGCFNFYPASYDNVISVASLRFNNQLVGNATYGYYVDVNALGANAHTTQPGGTNTYGPATGSSFAGPIVAGVAGLVRSHRPELNALQVGELIRVSGDKNDDTPGNESAVEKMGKNLNAYNALRDTTSSSVRTFDWQFEKQNPFSPTDGDTVLFVIDFQNYLAPVSNLSITITSANATFTTLNDSVFVGDLGTLDSADNVSNPFILSINPGTNMFDTLLVRVEYKGDNHLDYQYINLPIWETNSDTITQKTTINYTLLSSCEGDINISNDTVDLFVSLTNNLIASNEVTGSLTSTTPGVSILQNISNYGPTTLLDTINNSSNHYRIALNGSFVHGDTLHFTQNITADTYSESYSFYAIIDTTSIDTINNEVLILNEVYTNSTGSFSFTGDTVNMQIDVRNINCDLTPYQTQVHSVSSNVSMIDSSWNATQFNRYDTITNSDSLFKFYVDSPANSGDTIYFEITHKSGSWTQLDTISLILDDINLGTIAGFENNFINNVKAFPNPFNDILTIQIEPVSNSKVEVVLYDELLRKVISKSVHINNNNTILLNTKGVANGYYILLLQQDDFSQRIKLVKIGQ